MADPVTAPTKGQSRIRTVLGQGIGLAASADARSDGSFYFGFSTTDRVRTKADDSLIVTLKTTKDLLGRGPYSEGVLPAGVWQMSGRHPAISASFAS